MLTLSVPLFIAAILVLFIVGIKCAKLVNLWDIINAPKREEALVQGYLKQGDAYVKALSANETAK